MKDVGAWLKGLGLGHYAKAFAENGVDARLLPELSNDDLKDLGVARLADRKAILRAIEHLSERTETTPSIRNAERRQLTVMFCDLVGSTEFSSRLDPEDYRAVICSWQDLSAEVVERCGGKIAKQLGDGLLVYFGYPMAHEDDSERALRAGLDLVRAIGDMSVVDGERLAVRIGIATGLVVVGDLIGRRVSEADAVLGDVPNLAARLQSAAFPDTVFSSDATRRLAAGAFAFRDLGRLDLKGLPEPVRAWQVLRAQETETRFEARTAGKVTSLVGRRDELDLLMAQWRKATRSKGQAVLLTGEPGIGKSRLCQALQEEIHHSPYRRLSFQCSQHNADRAFHPFASQLRMAARIDPYATVEESLNALRQYSSRSGIPIEEDLPALRALLSIPESDRLTEPVFSSQLLKEQIFRALLRQLAAIQNGKPIFVLFEDLHWIDSSSAEFINRVVTEIEDLPLLLVATARPDYFAPWSDQSHVTTVRLGRISGHKARDMVSLVAGNQSLAEDEIEEIEKKSDGIPLYIEELTRAYLYTLGRISGARDRPPSIQIPASLHDSLMARLDGLSCGKRIAQEAAVIGREFSDDLLRRVSTVEARDYLSGLEELVESGLVIPPEADAGRLYAFKHVLVQEAAYDSLLREQRRSIHRRIADTLARRSADEPALLAFHWERAGDLERALECRCRAAVSFAARFGLWEAMSQYWRALDLLDQLPNTLTNQIRRVTVLVSMTRVPAPAFWRNKAEEEQARRRIEESINFAKARDDAVSALRLRAYCEIRSDPADETKIAGIIDAAEATRDNRLLAEVSMDYASFLGSGGRYEQSYRHLDRTIGLYEKLGASEERAQVLAGPGRCFYARGGELTKSIGLALEARRVAETTRNQWLCSWISMEAEPYFYRGDWERTASVVEEFQPIAWEIGNWHVILWTSGWAALAYIKLGRIDDAELILDRALSGAAPKIDLAFPKAYPQIAKCQLLVAQGDNQAALGTAQDVLAITEQSDLILECGAAFRASAEAKAAGAGIQQAESDFKMSLQILGGIQAKPEFAQSLLAYGIFKQRNRDDSSRALLGRALELFEEMDAPGWIDEARRSMAV